MNDGAQFHTDHPDWFPVPVARPVRWRGEVRDRSYLSPELRAYMRQLKASGCSCRQIAALVGCSVSTVHAWTR